MNRMRSAGVRRLYAIVNPAAGSGRAAGLAADALARLRQTGFEVETSETSGPRHGVELAADAWRRGERAFVVVGGDGTAFEAINGILSVRAGSDPRPVLGFLPLGTGNSFIRDFGLLDAHSALEAVVRDRPRPCDVLEIAHAEGTLYSINLISLGFSARVGALTNQRFKGLGKLGYPVGVVAALAGLRAGPQTVELDGGPRDARPVTLLSFCNSRYTGGTMEMAPGADPTDGQLDVLRVGALGRFGLLRAFPKIYRGTHLSVPGVEGCRARQVVFSEPVMQDVMIDGEVERIALRAIRVRPAALELLV